MLKFIIKNRNYIIGIILLMLLILVILIKNNNGINIKTYSYFGTKINITLYSKNKIAVNESFKTIDNIYQKINKLNLNINSNKYTLVDKDIIKIAKEFKKIEELSNKKLGTLDINNNHIKGKINLNFLKKAYANKKIETYLKTAKTTSYIISSGSNISLGNYNKGYKVGLESPNGDIVKVLKLKNTSVVTATQINNQNGLYDGVAVIASDNMKATIFSNALLFINKEEGLVLAKKNNLKVIWYNNQIETYGIKI